MLNKKERERERANGFQRIGNHDRKSSLPGPSQITFPRRQDLDIYCAFPAGLNDKSRYKSGRGDSSNNS